MGRRIKRRKSWILDPKNRQLFCKFKGLPPVEVEQLFDHTNLSPSLFIFPSNILYPFTLPSRVAYKARIKARVQESGKTLPSEILPSRPKKPKIKDKNKVLPGD
jgi:hypothetical protein